MLCLVFSSEEGKGSETRRGGRRVKGRMDATEVKEWADIAVKQKLLKRDQKREGSIGTVEEERKRGMED